MAMAAYNALTIPGADDNMEISSPSGAPRPFDDDTDILDFDDYQPTNLPANQQPIDFNMLDDADGLSALHTEVSADDELMDDDGENGQRNDGVSVSVVEEHEMRDQNELETEEVDEELLDYGDENNAGEIVEFDFSGDAEAADPTLAEGQEPVADDGVTAVYQHNEQEGEQPHETEAEQVTEVSALQEEHASQHTDKNDDNQVVEEINSSQKPEQESSQTQAVPTHEAEENERDVDEEDNTATSQLPAIDTGAATPTDNGRSTPTDTGLHAMNLRYGDMSMPLFKSRRQPDGLLKSDNVANLSLAELMQQCRQKLAVKIGDDISDDQEIALSFDQLGLILIEDSRPSFESSLNEVLEIYLQLHQNDHTTDIPPLSMSISLRLKFASSLATLKQAAAGGQGMSGFTMFGVGEIEDGDFEHGLASVDENFDQTEEVEDTYDYEGDEGEHYDDTTYVEGREDATEFDDETLIAPNDEGQGADEQFEKLGPEERHYENDGFGDDDNDKNKGLATTEHTKSEVFHSETHEDVQQQVLHHDQPAITASDIDGYASETAKAIDNSAVELKDKSSEHADSGIDQSHSDFGLTGEYEEDQIDWDEDPHLTLEKLDNKEDQDDFSSLTYDQPLEQEHQEREEMINSDAHAGSRVIGTAPVTAQATAITDQETAQHELDADQTSNEAVPPNEGLHDREDDAGARDGDDLEDDLGEHNYDETDNFGEEFDHYQDDHPSDLDDDDQFHTAHDLSAELYQNVHTTEQHYDEGDTTQSHTDHTVEAATVDFSESHEALDPDDLLDFDGDESTALNSVTQLEAEQRPTVGSPGTKRSFDDHAEDDDFEDDEPETKKAKSS